MNNKKSNKKEKPLEEKLEQLIKKKSDENSALSKLLINLESNSQVDKKK